MKRFLGIFIWCVILSYVFLLFGGFMIFESVFAICIFSGLALTVLATIFRKQSDEIDALEKRITELENKIETK